MIRITKVATAIVLLTGVTLSVPVSAGGLGKWLRNEVIPTFQGKRPIKIDPKRLKITTKGKKILDLDLKKDTLYIKAGSVSFKTGHLKKNLVRAGAVFSGDTAVISEVATEQFKKELAKAQRQGLVKVSRHPPAKKVTVPKKYQPKPKPLNLVIGRTVTIYNQTPTVIRYALNEKVYRLNSGEGYKHSTEGKDFFLQYDNNLAGEFNIARYFLTGKEYGLLIKPNQNIVSILKHK